MPKVMIFLDDAIYEYFKRIPIKGRSAFLRECLALRWALEECNLFESVVATLEKDAELRNAEDDVRFYEILRENLDKKERVTENKALKDKKSTKKRGKTSKKREAKALANRKEIEKYKKELERLEAKKKQTDELSELKAKVRKLKWEQTTGSLGILGDVGKKAVDYATMKGVTDEEKQKKIKNIDEMLGKLYGEEPDEQEERVTARRKTSRKKRRQPNDDDDDDDVPFFDPFG